MSDHEPDGAGAAPDPEPAGYRPKPPLWRPSPRRMPRSEIVLVVVGFVIVAALAVVLGEPQFLSTPATETPLTITGVESTDPAGKHQAAKIHYQVRLPDGSGARFASSHVYPLGTRLRAMVAHGLITKRVLVTPPYVALPDE